MLTIRKTPAFTKTLAAAVVLGATGLALPMASTSAEAMPALDAAAMRDVAVIHDGAGARIDQVRWVCGPYRCHWAPNYYGYGPGYGYGPRWGYRRGWGYRRWRRW